MLENVILMKARQICIFPEAAWVSILWTKPGAWPAASHQNRPDWFLAWTLSPSSSPPPATSSLVSLLSLASLALQTLGDQLSWLASCCQTRVVDAGMWSASSKQGVFWGQGVSQATKTGLVTCAMLIQCYFSLGCKIYNFKCKKVTVSLITIIR